MTSKHDVSFENLQIWHESVSFADKFMQLAENIREYKRHYRLIDHLENAATSPALKIAKGKGRFHKKEFMQYLYVARGSLFETVTLLEILRKGNLMIDEEHKRLKQQVTQLGKRINTLTGTIKRSL